MLVTTLTVALEESTAIEYAWEALLEPLVTLMVKFEVLVAVGVPVMVVVAPVEVPSTKPTGSDPAVTLQVNGPAAVVEAVSV
jgi:hypothetical protein